MVGQEGEGIKTTVVQQIDTVLYIGDHLTNVSQMKLIKKLIKKINK